MNKINRPLFCLLVVSALLPIGCPPAPSKTAETPLERLHMSLVREQPGSARVEGIGPLAGFAKGKDCTFIACLEAILEATGRKIDYDELMGLSGLAFRLQFRVDKWDVGNPDPVVGENCLPALFAAIGWEYDVRVVRSDELADADALQRQMQESIDKGLPMLAANIIPPEDWGIVLGYRRNRVWLCRSYNGGAEAVDKNATGWPTAVVFLTKRKNRPATHPAHVDSLKRAIALFDERGKGDYSQGRKAFDNWISNLQHPSERSYVHANFWTYINLIDARGAAVRYLRSIANEFGGKANNLTIAADAYEKEVRLLIDGLPDVPSARQYPDSVPPVANRRQQIETLRRAQALEDRAIESVRRAQ